MVAITVPAIPSARITRGYPAMRCNSADPPPNTLTYMESFPQLASRQCARIPSKPDVHIRHRRVADISGEHRVLLALGNAGFDHAANERPHHLDASIERHAVLPYTPLRVERHDAGAIRNEREHPGADHGHALLTV